MRKLSALVALLLVLAPIRFASAQTGSEAVTLEASAAKIAYGKKVTLSGTVSPASAGQTVAILDEADATVATASTDAGGSFSARLEPDWTRTYRATWGAAVSPEVRVGVRALVTVRMSPVRLFDRVTVRGTVEPARAGDRVEVTLLSGDRIAFEREVEMGAAGGFVATFRVTEPGWYRARASFSAPDLLRGTATTDVDAPTLPSLRPGSRGPVVRLLEQRLVELHYRLTGAADGVFDHRTADAVIAFHKVQRMARVTTVGAATWRRLADPLVPRPRHEWRGLHLEVDQTRQVLLTVEDGEVTNILHVSTGKPSTPTRDGVFRVARKLAGYSPNRLYYPSYFDGNRALHGWPDVPTYAASHGCVRIPYWNALWVFGLADYGIRVAVYH
ncbi:MAG: L,D-transpeptidase family protein [Actinomycetota bacterium]